MINKKINIVKSTALLALIVCSGQIKAVEGEGQLLTPSITTSLVNAAKSVGRGAASGANAIGNMAKRHKILTTGALTAALSGTAYALIKKNGKIKRAWSAIVNKIKNVFSFRSQNKNNEKQEPETIVKHITGGDASISLASPQIQIPGSNDGSGFGGSSPS